MKKIFILSRDKHFTRSSLAKKLNEEFPPKTSGRKYTPADIQQYAINGRLPKKLGHNEIKEIKDDQFGLFVEVDFNKKEG